MAATGIQVTGLREATASLRRAGADVADMKEEFAQLGNEIAIDARRNTPVGRPRKGRTPGRLRASVRASRRYNGIIITAGGAQAPYAKYVHYGTKHMRATPFVRQVLENMDLQRELESIINNIMRKAGL